MVALILQQNMGKRPEALVLLIGTAKERGSDLMLIQEPPPFEGNRHPAFQFLRAERVLAARRIDSDWAVTTEDGFTRDAEGGVQVLRLGRRGHSSRVLRAVNAYF